MSMAYGGVRGDTLWVYDGRLRRITFVAPTLELLRTVSWPTTPIVLQTGQRSIQFDEVYANAVTHDGAIYASLTLREPQPGFPMGVNRRGIVEMDGSVRRIIAAYEPGPSEYRIERPNVIAAGRFPFAVLPYFETNGTGSHYGLVLTSVEGPEAGTFEVVSLNADGDSVYARRYPFEVVALPASVADSSINAAATAWDSRVAGMGDAYRALAWVPPMYPPVEGLVVGGDGSMWIRLRPNDEATSQYLVLAPNGDSYGQATFEGDVQIMSATQHEAWGVIVDELDVHSIVRYSVEVGSQE
jgi:hypothetical protein